MFLFEGFFFLFLFLLFEKIAPQLELFLEVLEVLVFEGITVLAILLGQDAFIVFEIGLGIRQADSFFFLLSHVLLFGFLFLDLR